MLEDLVLEETVELCVRKTALFDKNRIYRYSLTREWKGLAAATGKTLFIMLNPSTADHKVDDPTIRRCMGFAQRFWSATLQVCNIFAFRSTDPKALKKDCDPEGPENDRMILEAAKDATRIIAAWGAHGKLHGRGEYVLRELLRGREVLCLKQNSDGSPQHPLYIPADHPVMVLSKGD